MFVQHQSYTVHATTCISDAPLSWNVHCSARAQAHDTNSIVSSLLEPPSKPSLLFTYPTRVAHQSLLIAVLVLSLFRSMIKHLPQHAEMLPFLRNLMLNAWINALMIVRRSILKAHHHHSLCKARRAMVTYIRRSCLDYAWAAR